MRLPQNVDRDLSLPVARAIAQPLSIKETVNEHVIEKLLSTLTTKQVLLVLDNFEHLLDAAVLIGNLLSAAEGLKVLATTREALRLSGEYEYIVSPLPANAALLLFEEQARAAQADFALTPENTPAVIEICRRLDGLPLAVELAAAYARYWSPQIMLRKLEQRLPMLVGGARDLPVRQQTLRNTLDWSYDLLDETERSLLRRLCVFIGGFTLDAAIQVCNFEIAGEETRTVQAGVITQDQILSLQRKSLIYLREIAGGGRHFMLETIREYALERLQPSIEGKVARSRHLDYFSTFVQGAEDSFLSGQLPESAWLAVRANDYDNVNGALSWAFHPEQANSQAQKHGASLASAMKTFWYMQGHLSEGRGWLERALAFSKQRDTLRASILAGIGLMAWKQGEYSLARAHLEESQSLLRELGRIEERETAFVLHVFGHVRFDQNDYQAVQALFSESLAINQRLGNPIESMSLVGDLGLVAYHLGAYGEARLHFEKGLAHAHAQGSKEGIAVHLSRLGDLACLEGNFALARQLFEESLANCREINDVLDIASSLHKLGQVVRQQGDYERAQSFLLESVALQKAQGNRQGIVECLAGMAGLCVDVGHPDIAARLFGAAEALLRSSARRWPQLIKWFGTATRPTCTHHGIVKKPRTGGPKARLKGGFLF